MHYFAVKDIIGTRGEIEMGSEDEMIVMYQRYLLILIVVL